MSDGWRNVRRTDPSTAQEAADTIDPADAIVLAAFLDANDRDDGWCRTELAGQLGWADYRTSKRMSDVRILHGLAVWAVTREGYVERPGPSGRPQRAVRSATALARRHGLSLDQVRKIAADWDAWLSRGDG